MHCRTFIYNNYERKFEETINNRYINDKIETLTELISEGMSQINDDKNYSSIVLRWQVYPKDNYVLITADIISTKPFEYWQKLLHNPPYFHTEKIMIGKSPTEAHPLKIRSIPQKVINTVMEHLYNNDSEHNQQYTYPIDAYSYETAIDGSEFRLIADSNELSNVICSLQNDQNNFDSYTNDKSDIFRFSITQNKTIMGCILFYNPYRIFLKIPCDTNLITALNKWLDTILHERIYVL